MKRISYAAMSTVSLLVLLFGYRTSTSSHAATANSAVLAPVTGGNSSASGSAASSTPSSAGSPPKTSSGAASSATAGGAPSSNASASKTVTGAVSDTRWGPVQVQLTVQNGKITKVSVVQYPNGNGRDQEINSQALPVLINETLSAQSSKIDGVSGASYTSQGYLASLQSAIDQAGL